MKQAPLQPYWQLEGTHKAYQVDHVQLFLWAKGICISGHSKDGSLVDAKAYEMQEIYDLETLEYIILNEPLLADPLPVKKVWMAVSRHIIFPQHIFARDLIDQWYQQLYFLEHDEELATSHANDLGIDVIYPKKAVVRELLGRYFPNRKSKFLIPPRELFKYFSGPDPYKVCILFMENTCSLNFFESERFVHNYIFEMGTVEDIILEIGNYWDDNIKEIGSVEIIAGGVASPLEKWQSELAQYFENVNTRHDFSTEIFLQELALCE